MNFTGVEDQESANAILAMLMGFGAIGIFVIFAALIVVWIFFIISQNKLINALAAENQTMPVSKVWTWTQIIPIWGLVALAVSIVKIGAQHDAYTEKHGALSKPYKPTLGWAYLISIIVSGIIPFIGIITLIIWIVYWVNIAGATKSIVFKNDNAQQAPQESLESGANPSETTSN